jgi:hypothetical protein
MQKRFDGGRGENKGLDIGMLVPEHYMDFGTSEELHKRGVIRHAGELFVGVVD